MSKISKILPATTFGFAPMVTNSLGQSYQSGPSTNLEPSWPIWANYFWISLEKNTPSLEHPLDIKQQFLSTLGWRKLIKNFSTYRWGITTSIYGINFNLTCSSTTGLPLFPNLIWILFLLLNITIFSNQQLPAQSHKPSYVYVLSNFFNWNNHSAPVIHYKWTNMTCCHFISMLTPFSHGHTYNGSQDLSRITLFWVFSASLSSLFHSTSQRPRTHMLHIFSLPLPLPPFTCTSTHSCPYFCALTLWWILHQSKKSFKLFWNCIKPSRKCSPKNEKKFKFIPQFSTLRQAGLWLCVNCSRLKCSSCTADYGTCSSLTHLGTLPIRNCCFDIDQLYLLLFRSLEVISPVTGC